jgi:hypothetical protein
MSLKRVTQCLLLASAVLMISSTLNAQFPNGSPPSGGRRTELEYLDKGFDLEGMTNSDNRSGYWNTPEGRARYLQNQMESLGENLEELSDLGKEDWATRYDAVSDRRSRRDFENRAEDLEDVTDDIIKFVEWRFDAEPIEVEAPSEESFRDALAQITPMVERILESFSTLTDGVAIPVGQFVEMRTKFAQIYALSRIVRD